jgi:hypothetical protein
MLDQPLSLLFLALLLGLSLVWETACWPSSTFDLSSRAVETYREVSLQYLGLHPRAPCLMFAHHFDIGAVDVKMRVQSSDALQLINDLLFVFGI